MDTHSRSQLIAVSRLRIKCPVCGKPDNCAVNEDRTVAYCRRVPSEHPGTDGGYTHILEAREVHHASGARRAASAPPAPIGTTPLASAAHLDRVYRELLGEHLRIEPRHVAALVARGLSEESIAARLYATVPSADDALEIADAMARSLDLTGVPGFFQERGYWHLHTGAWNRGVLVPVKNSRGMIVGIIIRLDEPDERGKYRWLTSASKGGCSPGVPPHFAAPDLVRQTGELVITEGALKSDVICELSGSAVCGLASVTTFNDDFGKNLRRALPDLKLVRVAFDADFRTNGTVLARFSRLSRLLRYAGLRVLMRTWAAAEGKGYDDHLLLQHTRVSEVA